MLCSDPAVHGRASNRRPPAADDDDDECDGYDDGDKVRWRWRMELFAGLRRLNMVGRDQQVVHVPTWNEEERADWTSESVVAEVEQLLVRHSLVDTSTHRSVRRSFGFYSSRKKLLQSWFRPMPICAASEREKLRDVDVGEDADGGRDDGAAVDDSCSPLHCSFQFPIRECRFFLPIAIGRWLPLRRRCRNVPLDG